jgi:acylphosphatase
MGACGDSCADAGNPPRNNAVAAKHTVRTMRNFDFRYTPIRSRLIKNLMRLAGCQAACRSARPFSLPQFAAGRPLLEIQSPCDSVRAWLQPCRKLPVAVLTQALQRLPLAERPAQLLSATISGFVSDPKQARRFFVSGLVQGVGFRYFAQDVAERLHLAGYVRNLRDGRVETYAIGMPAQLTQFRAALERGPWGATVHEIKEEHAAIDSQYAHAFSITFDA